MNNPIQYCDYSGDIAILVVGGIIISTKTLIYLGGILAMGITLIASMECMNSFQAMPVNVHATISQTTTVRSTNVSNIFGGNS
jgi:hypothetical protein